MFVFSVQLTLVFLFFTALSLLVTKVVSRRTHDVTGERQEWVSKITSAVEEGYSGRLVLRAFNRERQSSAEVHQASGELARVSAKADFMINAVGPAVRFIGRLAQIVIALVGCSMLVAGHMTVGVFQAFFQFIYEASEPMTQLSFTFNSLQSALASAERVFDLLDEPEMEADPLPDEAAKLPGRVEGRVSFEHVRFGYSPDKPLMHDVSFTAEPGQKIAVVGTTGAGKTTLIREIVAALGSADTVTSPTFAIVNQYKAGKERIHHFDFYRIDDQREAYDFGYEEYFYSGDLCLVEWPEKIEQLLPENTMNVRITADSDTARTFEID